MNEEQSRSTPQECIDKLDLIELHIRDLVSTLVLFFIYEFKVCGWDVIRMCGFWVPLMVFSFIYEF